MKYSAEQIDCLRMYYPDSNYSEIFKVFPDKTKRQIKGIAHYYGIKSNNPGHAIDLTGEKFGKLTVLGVSNKKDSKIYWECECDCGNIIIVPTANLRCKKQIAVVAIKQKNVFKGHQKIILEFDSDCLLPSADIRDLKDAEHIIYVVVIAEENG